MNRGFPSMTALLGLLAVAGFQNRDKIGEMLSGLGRKAAAGGGQPAPAGRLGELFDHLMGSPGSAGAGGFLRGGLGELVDRFKQNGAGATAESWVAEGPNQQIAPPQLEQAIGPDVLETLSQTTGLTRDELLNRLSRELPGAVDRYTPAGRLPA